MCVCVPFSLQTNFQDTAKRRKTFRVDGRIPATLQTAVFVKGVCRTAVTQSVSDPSNLEGKNIKVKSRYTLSGVEAGVGSVLESLYCTTCLDCWRTNKLASAQFKRFWVIAG